MEGRWKRGRKAKKGSRRREGRYGWNNTGRASGGRGRRGNGDEIQKKTKKNPNQMMARSSLYSPNWFTRSRKSAQYHETLRADDKFVHPKFSSWYWYRCTTLWYTDIQSSQQGPIVWSHLKKSSVIRGVRLHSHTKNVQGKTSHACTHARAHTHTRL